MNTSAIELYLAAGVVFMFVWFAAIAFSDWLSRLPSHGPDTKPREHNGYSDHYPPPETWGPRERYRESDRQFDADFDCVSESLEQAPQRSGRLGDGFHGARTPHL